MNYYIEEIQTSEGVQKTAGVKARDDAIAFLKNVALKNYWLKILQKGEVEISL